MPRAYMTRLRQELAVQQFSDGAPGLIDGHVGVSAGAGVGIRDGNLAKNLAPDDPGLLSFFPIGIEERIRRERVAVRPTIDGDALDVLGGIESRATEHARQLVADVSFEF